MTRVASGTSSPRGRSRSRFFDVTAGLLIPGGMVLVTLRRQEFERVLTRIRSGLAGWE